MLELSSYQIDLTKSLDCDVAVLLNITPDHLDRYESFEAYAASKARLFEMQSEQHKAVATAADWWGRKIHDVAGSGILDVSDDAFHVWQAEPGAIGIFEQANWPSLQGPHNLANVESAMSCCFLLGLDGHQIRKRTRNLPRPPAPYGAHPREGRRPLRQRQQGDQPDRHRARARRVRSHPLDLRRAGEDRQSRRVRTALRPCPLGLHDRRGGRIFRAALVAAHVCEKLWKTGRGGASGRCGRGSR